MALAIEEIECPNHCPKNSLDLRYGLIGGKETIVAFCYFCRIAVTYKLKHEQIEDNSTSPEQAG